MRMIDPPTGWKYGFPKELPDDIKDLRQWFIDNGYPEKSVDLALQYSRSWEELNEEKE